MNSWEVRGISLLKFLLSTGCQFTGMLFRKWTYFAYADQNNDHKDKIAWHSHQLSTCTTEQNWNKPDVGCSLICSVKSIWIHDIGCSTALEKEFSVVRNAWQINVTTHSTLTPAALLMYERGRRFLIHDPSHVPNQIFYERCPVINDIRTQTIG